MHTTRFRDEELDQTVSFIHDGDYGGTMYIVAKMDEGVDQGDDGRVRIELSSEVLFKFLAEKLRNEKIAKLEGLTTEEVFREIW